VDDLWLVGGGDPLLATPEHAARLAGRPRTRDVPTTSLDGLAEQVATQGIRVVLGAIHGDDSRYERLRTLPSWRPGALSNVGVLGALTVNGGAGRAEPAGPSPATRAAAELSRLLTSRGIGARPGPDEPAPPGAIALAQVHSAPLDEIVAAMLRSSDNLAAELLLRELDRQAGGEGTSSGGIRLVAQAATRLGLPVGGLQLADGSGLSSENRNTCRLLIATLALADRPRFDALGRGLAVAGRTGTLAHRFLGTPLEGQLAAKTGWIAGAAGMVGTVGTTPPLDFAFLANGSFGWPAARALEDRIILALAELARAAPGNEGS
jgi:D-alanyl-D-alanine carboxypeptidase/D-alanyl-D-alanine-endopeptidase (penicillin-binding protein 4)